MKQRLTVVLTLIVLVLTTGLTSAGAGAEPPPNRQYTVDGVSTQEQRTAVARTGAAIDEVAADRIVVTATSEEVAAIRASATRSRPHPTGSPRSCRSPSTSRPPTAPTTTSPSSTPR